MRTELTDAERVLWRLLRGRRIDGWKFRRQHPVPPYVLDFACVEAHLAVEADGGQHNGSLRDDARAEFLVAAGWRVLRFWNNDILANPDGVGETIRVALVRG
ncbi:endonuclease domain-containing protein [Azospirillum rugosum]|uniref:Primosomal protein N' (Replication factor Y) n=1 Tax=Azospirillum rugosum TaxID=416170 RepID=A0ABS4SRM1_9PROT|nr:primosomal protein N' (replication factor Y) [Azospirillum rugosum]MDQ0528583.1 primosomal protein N' (replication factor Y) [Azospirillum rugosum]